MTVDDMTLRIEHRRQTLDEHINLGRHKPVSYLPIQTIEKVLGLTISDYKSMVEHSGNICAVFVGEESCIESGAVYAFSRTDLDTILVHHVDILRECDEPATSDEFIKKIAEKWFDTDHPIFPVIQMAFGGT